MHILFTFFMLLFTLTAQATFISPCRFQKAGICFSKTEWDRFWSDSHAANGGTVLMSTNATAGRGTSFQWGASGSAFQVGVGRTLNCLAADVSVNSGTALAYYGVSLGTSTAAVTFDTASPGTSPVYYFGTSLNAGSSNQEKVEIALNWDVAYPLYPFMASGGGGVVVKIYCLID